MAQFSRLTTEIDALLDELVAARGEYSSLSAAIAAKAGAAEIAEITAAIAALAARVVKKMSLTCDTEITSGDADCIVNVGSYYFTSENIQDIDNLPSGLSAGSRLDVIELPGDLRQQILRSTDSTPSVYIRNSTSEPEPATSPIIPAMTSATTPSGEVIESGHYQSRYGYLAFDGTDSQTWSSHAWSDGTNILDGTADKCYVGYSWGAVQTVSSVKISFSSDTAYTCCIQCRIDGVWQTVISSISISGYPYYSVFEQVFDSPVECDAIRFCVLSGNQERFCANTYGGNVCEFTVYGEGGMKATWGAWTSVSMA